MSYEDVSYITRIAGLLYFVTIFLAVIVYVFWPTNADGFDRAARMPLDEGASERREG